jgi:hypothetical protein
LGAHGVAERERFFTRGAEAPRTSRIGHVYYKYTASQQSAQESSRAWWAGMVGGVVRWERESPAVTLHAMRQEKTGECRGDIPTR